MQQRYYDPVSMRFISPDPLAASAQNFNRYWYANNNPMKYTDPDGRKSEEKDDVPPKEENDGVPDDLPETTLAAVAVTAPRSTTMPFPNSGSIGSWIGRSVPTLLLIYPGSLDAPECELPGGPACVAMSSEFPPGYWPGDKGGEEWGRRNGVGAKEGKGRFHGIKQKDGGRPTDKYGVDPATGDVIDPEGEVVGNLEDVKSK